MIEVVLVVVTPEGRPEPVPARTSGTGFGHRHLAITGMQETQMLGTGYQQEVSLPKLYMDVAEYNEMILVPAQVNTLVDLAVRHALARRGVSHLTIPTDVQVAKAGSNPWSAPAPAVIKETAARYLEPPGQPRAADLQRAAEILNEGRAW